MAYGATFWNDPVGVSCSLFNLSNFGLMEWIQTVLVILSGVSALLFLFRKVVFKKKTANNKGCDSNCGCH
jgi:hypothetical protein